MNKRIVWLNVSIEVNDEAFPDDESMMDYANELATGAGFIVDDMGMFDPSDMDKFYPTEEVKS